MNLCTFGLGQKLKPEAAKAETAGDIFDLFFPRKLLDKIVYYTNKYVIFRFNKMLTHLLLYFGNTCNVPSRVLTISGLFAEQKRKLYHYCSLSNLI